MSKSDEELVAEAINGLIAQAIKDGGLVDAAHSASVIAKAYPASGQTVTEIAERIIATASYARVAVKISKTATPDTR